MCNLSELVKERAVKQEQISAVERMLKTDATKEQIISFGYTEKEIERAENALYANVSCFSATVKTIGHSITLYCMECPYLRRNESEKTHIHM
ncbi:hypothetical protein AALB53_16560 [Lachnospiraceae bacterium 47-T17]